MQIVIIGTEQFLFYTKQTIAFIKIQNNDGKSELG
jgi:hypothetical protein